MSMKISRHCYALVNFGKAIWLIQTNVYFEKSGSLSSTEPESLDFSSHCSVNFQPIFNCFIPNVKLKYEKSENVKTGRVNTVVSTHIKSNKGTFFGTPGSSDQRSKVTDQMALIRGH